MFTGLVEAVGIVEGVSDTAAGRELRLSCPWQDLEPGESVALNGACLTVRACGREWFTVAAVVTTADRTTINTWAVGRRVNLERAVRAGDRLGGHLVQGHVDDTGAVMSVSRRDSALLVDIGIPAALVPLMVPHGSIAVDGVSLTVNAIPSPGIVQVALIEWTEHHTTLGGLRPGDRVHVEADVVGKYVRSLLAPWQAPRGDP